MIVYYLGVQPVNTKKHETKEKKALLGPKTLVQFGLFFLVCFDFAFTYELKD